MSRFFLLGLIAAIPAYPARAADEPPKEKNKVERTAEKAGKAIDNTARKVGNKVKKTATKAGDAIEHAGKKTENWVKEKTN